MTALNGTAVTIMHVDSTTSVVVTAASPREVRSRLNTWLTEGERPAFIALDAVDEDNVFFINLDQVAYFEVEPQVLADLDAPAPTKKGAK